MIWAPISVMALLAARFLPFGQLPVPPCTFRMITGVPCLTCGGTRSLTAVAHLDLAAAFLMNPLVALAGLAAAAYVVHAAGVWALGWPRWRPSVSSPRARRLLRIAVIGAVLLNWTYLIAVGR